MRGAREHNLRNIDVEIPRERLVVITGLSGSGQVLARVRHDLRRGTAPLRRVAVGVRAAVPRADGEAGRRRHRGALAGDLDRAEDGEPQPALHGRHRHRDLRLPPPPLGAGRASRTARTAAAGRAGSRPPRSSDRLLALAGGHPDRGARPARARPEGRVPGPVRGGAEEGLRACARRRRDCTTSRSRRGSTATRTTTSRWSWTGSWSASRTGSGWPTRSRRRCARRTASSRSSSTATDPTRGSTCSASTTPARLRHQPGRAGAAPVLVQLAVRRVRGLRRARDPQGGEPGPPRRRPDHLDPRGRHPAVGRAVRASRGARSSPDSPRPTSSSPTRPGASCPRRVRHAVLHGSGGRKIRSRTRRVGKRDTTTTPGKASSPTSCAATTRPGRTPCAISSTSSCRRCRAPRATEPGSRPERGRSPWVVARSGRSSRCRSSRGASRSSHRPRAGRAALAPEDRGTDPEGGPGAARLPVRRRARVPDARAAPPARCRAARPSGSGWPPRSEAGWWACCTSWTSRRSGSISGTTTGCSSTLRQLRDLGNTVLVVEHDEDTIRAADWIVDLGPGRRPARWRGRRRRARSRRCSRSRAR